MRRHFTTLASFSSLTFSLIYLSIAPAYAECTFAGRFNPLNKCPSFFPQEPVKFVGYTPRSGGPITANGNLLRNSRGTVWFMNGGKRHGILHPTIFEAYGFQPNAVRDIPDASINAIPEGPLLPFPTGTLIRNSRGTVWVMEVGYKRGIPSPEVFKANRFGANTIRNVPDEIIKSIPEGPIITAP